MAVSALKQWFSLKFIQYASIIGFEMFWIFENQSEVSVIIAESSKEHQPGNVGFRLSEAPWWFSLCASPCKWILLQNNTVVFFIVYFFQYYLYFNKEFDWFWFYWMKMRCVSTCLALIMNEYSNGFVVIFYAIERFILIIFPLQAKRILTKRYYMAGSIAIICISASLMIAGISVEWYLVQIEDYCING